MSTNTQKLKVIRSRTDHDLLILVERYLNCGNALLNTATMRSSPLFAEAERAHQRAMILLSKVSGLEKDDRTRTEDRVKELRSRLDQVPAFANVRSYRASLAS